jgi:hypothetical protein
VLDMVRREVRRKNAVISQITDDRLKKSGVFHVRAFETNSFEVYRG